MPGKICTVCGEWDPETGVHQCAGRRTVPRLPGPQEWGLDDHSRIAALAAINEQARSALQPSGVLFYPGSGADVANALFACYSRVRTFVFVDNWQGGGGQSASLAEIADSFPSHFPALSLLRRLDAGPAGELADSLHIGAAATRIFAYEFSFHLEKRWLLFVRQAFEAFLDGNPNFQCNVFFVKDMAGTASSVTHDMVVPHLATNGLYVSNALDDSAVPFLPLFGLRFVLKTAPVGFTEMIVCQKQSALGSSEVADRLRIAGDAMDAAKRFMQRADEDYELYDKTYAQIQADEPRILTDALMAVRQVLQGYVLSTEALYNMCAACVRKQAAVAAWGTDAGLANEPLYRAAWLRTLNSIIRSRPHPGARRPPRRRPRFQGGAQASATGIPGTQEK